MSLKKEKDVDRLIDKYLKKYPTASRAQIHTYVRLEYENLCLRHEKMLDQRQEKAFLRRLDRKLAKAFLESAVRSTPSSAVKNTGTLRTVESEEDTIKKTIQEHFPSGILLYSQTKYRPTTDVVEETIRDAGIQAGRDPKDPKFRDLVFKVIKKLREEENH